ncbi:MAG: hypothetical protein ACO25B_04005 [Chitinophagaceae bacterium]
MKKSIVFLCCLLFVLVLQAQVIRDHRRDGKPVPTKPNPVPSTEPGSVSQVTIYENADFNGRSRSFGAGDYVLKSQADMNDLASSFRVPEGWVVLLFEHANEKGGYGNYIDLMEDCRDLSVYNFNDKTSFLRVFRSTRPGYVYVRNRVQDNRFIAGHWEREKANGSKPDNNPPAIASSLSDDGSPNDFTYAPAATQAEIDELYDIMNHQSGIAVLGGESTQPIYYHHNRDGEQVYKYNKVIDPARLPGKFFDWAAEKLGRAGFLVKPFAVVTDVATDIKDWIFGSSSTKMEMDCWYPVSEYRTTVCGTMKENAFLCPQDYMHTQVTIDKDVCFSLVPSDRFRSVLSNRWLDESTEDIEGEVRPVFLSNYNSSNGKTTESTTPRNPVLMQIREGEEICMYGPWMGDILDLNLKIPIPLTNEKIELGNIDLRKHNEIHPVNQIWRKKGNETQLTAIVDGTGYFEKTGNGEKAASGLGQRMRFYKAFMIQAGQRVMNRVTHEILIDGIGFDFTDYPASEIREEQLTIRSGGVILLTVKDNSLVRSQKTHKVFFENVKKRPDGNLQGYIVIETEPITKKGGSINIIIRENSSGGLRNPDGLPVRTMQ